MSSNLPISELVTIYTTFIRSILEQSAVVWHAGLTEGQHLDLERVQKVAARIILRNNYISYEDALEKMSLNTLRSRREDLCLRFAQKCVKTNSSADMFPLNMSKKKTRHREKFSVCRANTQRLRKSAIPYMQHLLNKFDQDQ